MTIFADEIRCEIQGDVCLAWWSQYNLYLYLKYVANAIATLEKYMGAKFNRYLSILHVPSYFPTLHRRVRIGELQCSSLPFDSVQSDGAADFVPLSCRWIRTPTIFL